MLWQIRSLQEEAFVVFLVDDFVTPCVEICEYQVEREINLRSPLKLYFRKNHRLTIWAIVDGNVENSKPNLLSPFHQGRPNLYDPSVSLFF